MTQNALTVLRFILAWGWRFFTGYHIPGTNVTPGGLLLFAFLLSFLLGWLRSLFNAQIVHEGKGLGNESISKDS